MIRSRFRRSLPWLQWPYTKKSDEVEEDEETNPKQHPVCTKSVELNADALLSVLEHFEGGFADIPKLQAEAWTFTHASS